MRNAEFFNAGRLSISSGAESVLKGLGVDPQGLLRRHLSADWGDIPFDRQMANYACLERKQPVTSIYQVAPNVRVTVTTVISLGLTRIGLSDVKVAVP